MLLPLLYVRSMCCTGFYRDGSGGVQFESALDFKNQVWESDAVWVVQFFALFSQKSELFVSDWEKSTTALSGLVNMATVEVSMHEDIAAAFGIHIHDESFP